MLPPSGARFGFLDARVALFNGALRTPPVGGVLSAYLDCPSHPDIVLAVTSSPLPPTGTLDGRDATLAGGMSIATLGAAAIARAAFPVCVLENRRSTRRTASVVVDVAAYAMQRRPDDQAHPLPYREPIYMGLSDDSDEGGGRAIGGYAPPTYALVPATLLYFDGAVWGRFKVTGGTLPNPRAPDAPCNLVVYAEAEQGTPLAACPRNTDYGAPFYLPDGRLHSFLTAVWEGPDGQVTTYVLIPAQVALAQLRALPALAGYDIRGFVAPESVAERVASMRDHAAPVVTPPPPALSSAGIVTTLAAMARSLLCGSPFTGAEEVEPRVGGSGGSGAEKGGEGQGLLLDREAGGGAASNGARVAGYFVKKKR